MAAGKKGKDASVGKQLPELFLASSAESLELTHQLQNALKHYFHAKPWTAGAVRPSKTPVQSLERELGKAQYAVFIFGNDDTVISRRRQYDAVRDNVLLELGMFIGRLGSERCFVVLPQERQKLKVPSDLEGFTPITYDADHFKADPESVAVSIGTDLRNAIRAVPASPPTGDAPARKLPDGAHSQGLVGVNTVLAGAIADVLETLIREADGPLRGVGRAALKLLSQTVLKNCLHVLRALDVSLPGNAYVAWLRPAGLGVKRKLSVFHADNLPAGYDHYPFSPNEGLAGTVWASGQPALHSPANPNPVWKVRQGCENATYIAVPVGSAKKTGGILALGSDDAFVAGSAHESVLEAFASVLAMLTG